MGDVQSKANSKLLVNTNPLVRKYLAPKPVVNPYREGYSAPQQVSVLQYFLDPNNNSVDLNKSYGTNQFEASRSRGTGVLPNRGEFTRKSSFKRDGRFGGNSPTSKPVVVSEAWSEEYEPQVKQQWNREGYSNQPSIADWDRPRSPQRGGRDGRNGEDVYYVREGGEKESFGWRNGRRPEDEREMQSSIREEVYERENPITWARRRDSPQRESPRREEFVSPYSREKQVSPYRNRGDPPKKMVEFERPRQQEERPERSPIRARPPIEKPAFQYRNKAEERFSPSEVEILRENYETYAKDGRLNKFSLLKMLSMEEFEESIIGTRMYSTMSQITSKEASFGSFVTYDRYVQAMAVLARGSAQERLDFIFTVFDPNGDGHVTREEMGNVLASLFKVLRSTKFENHTLNMLNERISEIDEDEVDGVLEELINEIFESFARDDNFLTFEEWKVWFTSQFGMQDILNYKIRKLNV